MDFATTKVATPEATDAAAASVKIVANLPFVIAINGFGGDFPHPADDVGKRSPSARGSPWLNATPGSGTRPWPR